MGELRRWGLVLVAGLTPVIALAACGDDEEGSAEVEVATTVRVENTDEVTSDTEEELDDAAGGAGSGGAAAGESSGGAFDFGSGVARVVIGDQTYEFDLTTGNSVCRDVFDAIQVAASNASGDVDVDIWIPPTDWETFTDGRYDSPSVSVEDDQLNVNWVADPGRSELIADFPAESLVTFYEKSGLSAAGTATFIDEYALMRGEAVEPVEGTFEVACVE